MSWDVGDVRGLDWCRYRKAEDVGWVTLDMNMERRMIGFAKVKRIIDVMKNYC